MNNSLKKRRRIEISREGYEILEKIGVFLIALFLSPVRFIFGSYPFGIAILACTKEETPFAFVGCIASVLLFMEGNLLYLIVYFALLVLRIAGGAWLGDGKTKRSLGRETKNSIVESFFTENVTVRVALASLSSFVIGVLEVISNEYGYFYIFSLVFTTVFVGIFTYTLSGFFNGKRDKSFLYGTVALAFAVVLALSKKELFGLDVSIVLTYCIVIYTSRASGMGASAATGALLGLCHGIEFAPCFAIMGMVSSLFWEFSYYLGIMSGALLSVGYGIFASGYEAIVYLLPEAALSSLVMYSLLRFEVLPHLFATSEEAAERSKDTNFLIEREKRKNKKILSLSESFASLAELSRESSMKSKRLSLEECRALSLETTETHCFSCPKRSICWEKDVATTEDNISSLADGIFSENEVTNDTVSRKFLHRCPNVDTIIKTLNEKKRAFNEDGSHGDKLEICKQGFDDFSRILVSLNEYNDDDGNLALSEKAERVASRIGLKFDTINIVGKREKTVIISNVKTESSKCSDKELKSELESVLSCSLTMPTFEQNGSICTAKLFFDKKYEVSRCELSSPLDKNTQNGDTLSCFSTENGKFYAIICDGMGSGESAYVTSSLCVEFLKKILSASPKPEHAISMLNTFVLARGAECSSSVDIAEIDLYNGECSFIKSGACSSFVKRGDRVFCLSSKTAPIGIMKSPDAERLSLSLMPNDVIVMMSDGIASDEGDYSAVTEILSKEFKDEASLAKEIISASYVKDDKSVIVLKISEAK